ncbi:MAG: molecular chaperone [Betaproteobacteria bacterium]
MNNRICTILLALIGMSALGTAQAASFHVSPVRIELSAARPVAVITVANNEDRAARIQLQLVSWSQDGNRDVYVDTGALIANPPIFTLKPKGSQTIRIGLSRPAATAHEQSYRVFLEELAEPANADTPTGLKIQLRIGLPIFVLPQQPVKPQLRWTARPVNDAIQLELKNDGDAHVQIREIKLLAGSGEKPLATINMADYILSGNSRTWLIKPGSLRKGEVLRLAAQTSVGAIHADIPMENP